MRKQILTIGTVVLIVFGSISFIGCGNAENNETEHSEHIDGEKHEMYQCPMKCESDKMYDEAGSCPVCGMDLVEVE
jgi:transcription initiation factor IIE alpha subunit